MRTTQMRRRQTMLRDRAGTRAWVRIVAVALLWSAASSGLVGCLVEPDEPGETSDDGSIDDGSVDDGSIDDGSVDDGSVDGADRAELEVGDDVALEIAERCPDGDDDHLKDPQPVPWHTHRSSVAPLWVDDPDDGDDGSLLEPQPHPWHDDAAAAEGGERGSESDREEE